MRAGRLDTGELRRTRALVERLWDDLDRVKVSEQLVRDAGELGERHALRAYDAVHLASALSAAGPDTVLVAADRGLLAAAEAVRFTTAPVL